MNLKKYIFLFIYYGIAKHLPKSSRSKMARKIRYLICRQIFLKCGTNVNIERGVWFGKGDKIVIGDNSGLGVNCTIPNGAKIGKNVMMGPNCYFLKSAHKFDSIEIPMRFQGVTRKRNQVLIKDDVWLGRDVLIIGDKVIEEGTIIGARTVLTKNFPSYSIVGGNPSKLIRRRN